ncbi:hypothetical protein CYLTODRAFT_415574, partial [Cylindrobasidium torrendii FP15055 ss-10]
SGSQLNIMKRSVYEKHLAYAYPEEPHASVRMTDASGQEKLLEGQICNVEFKCGIVPTRANVYLGPESLPFDLLLGRPWQRDNLVGIKERPNGTFVTFNNFGQPELRPMEICVGREAIYNLPVLEPDSESSNEEDNDLADTEDNSEEEDSFLIRLNPLQKPAQVIPPERAKYLAQGYLVSSIHISKPDSDPQLKLQRVKAKQGHKRQLADCVETSGPQKMQGIEQVLEIHLDASQASITHVSDSKEGKEPITFSANPHQHCRVASPTLKHNSMEEQMDDKEMDSMSMAQQPSPIPSRQASPVPSGPTLPQVPEVQIHESEPSNQHQTAPSLSAHSPHIGKARTKTLKVKSTGTLELLWKRESGYGTRTVESSTTTIQGINERVAPHKQTHSQTEFQSQVMWIGDAGSLTKVTSQEVSSKYLDHPAYPKETSDSHQGIPRTEPACKNVATTAQQQIDNLRPRWQVVSDNRITMREDLLTPAEAQERIQRRQEFYEQKEKQIGLHRPEARIDSLVLAKHTENEEVLRSADKANQSKKGQGILKDVADRVLALAQTVSANNKIANKIAKEQSSSRQLDPLDYEDPPEIKQEKLALATGERKEPELGHNSSAEAKNWQLYTAPFPRTQTMNTLTRSDHSVGPTPLGKARNRSYERTGRDDRYEQSEEGYKEGERTQKNSRTEMPVTIKHFPCSTINAPLPLTYPPLDDGEPHATFTSAFPAFLTPNNHARPPPILAFTPIDHRFGRLISRAAQEVTEHSDNAEALSPAILVTPAAARLVPLHDEATGRTLEVSVFFNARHLSLREGIDPSVHIGTTLVVTIDGKIDAQFLPALERTYAGSPSGKLCGFAAHSPYLAPDGRTAQLSHNGGFLPLDLASAATTSETQANCMEFRERGLTAYETVDVLKQFPTLPINHTQLGVRLTDIPAPDRGCVAALVEELASIIGSAYSRNGELKGLGLIQPEETPRNNSVTFPLLANLLLDRQLFTLRSSRLGPIKPSEHQIAAANVFQLAVLDSNGFAHQQSTVGSVSKDLGTLTSDWIDDNDMRLVESRFLTNVTRVDRQLFDIRDSKYKLHWLSYTVLNALPCPVVPLCGPLLHALRESQEDLPHLESVTATPPPSLIKSPVSSPAPASPTQLSDVSIQAQRGSPGGSDMILTNDEELELREHGLELPEPPYREPTVVDNIGADTGPFITERFIACPLPPIQRQHSKSLMGETPTYVIREACHLVDCVRKREICPNPNSPCGLACGMVGQPFDGQHLTKELDTREPMLRVGVWKGPPVQDISVIEDGHLLHPLSPIYFPTSATLAAVDRAIPVYEVTRTAEKLVSAMAQPPRLYTAAPGEFLTDDQTAANESIRQAVYDFEREQELGEHDLAFKTAGHAPVTHYTLLGPPLDSSAPNLAIMRYQNNVFADELINGNPDLRVTYFNICIDRRPSIIRNVWREATSLSRLRDARRYVARFVEWIVLLAQATVFHSAVNVLPDDHPTHHYFYHHCHVLRYLVPDCRDANQGFNYICGHVNPAYESVLTDDVISGVRYLTYNPLLTGEEDELLQHAAVVLEFLQCGHLANECRKLRRLPTYAPAAIRTLLEQGYLEPVDNYDETGRLFPYILN